ncbi:putative ATP-dependent helicase Lhr [Enhygromyxa salina]|uniref:Putative ATP-dependent helicase Lhr n=2 Tax=Enhygromyxa salina TaxID=215803 RepID=A0A2S9XUH7_9BACT|nr:putative ATP-dependent helicase Lhr [Enhygromyxa salina]
MDSIAPIALLILDELQRREARLLAWGMVDGAFTEDELIEIATEVVEREGATEDPEDALQWLTDAVLLVLLEPNHTGRYRTRMGEGVRLFASLRQWFPTQRWTAATPLVADFRFVLRPRRYPARNIPVTDALARIEQHVRCDDLQRSVALALLGGADSTWQLADFQVEATQRVLSEATSNRTSATIVCAGTGSGKTLAFYLPAFMHIARQMSSEPSTQCLALYPRIELLRDQLSTAVANATRVESVLRRHHGRPMSIGVLYGGVPRRAAGVEAHYNERAWPLLDARGARARRCPYLDCPDCGGALAWPETDRAREVERLVCTRCEFTLDGERLRLTRKSMCDRPPDLLFTTTEMLNRSLANCQHWPLFGLGNRRPPSLVLLDEVHTYGGSSGAQVGLTLRRWRHRSGAQPHFVGLSATLAEATRFMSQLVGTYASRVATIEPRVFVTEGCEQILALRSRPKVATLSTTIQASMLLRRLLDAESCKSKGAAGERIFVFTDNLDVTNRLYFQLGDAEGWYRPHRPRRPAPHPPLASLRRRGDHEYAARLAAGQAWSVCEDIGHALDPKHRAIVSRTSSQDTGVTGDAEIVVATASLEVGFDDPKVGGIVQHGAPLDPAAYLQRRGRAGRGRVMRPWTVVVLSDWGKDKQAYRAYEHLFSPHVPPRHLPIKNRHVLRMQATLACMDWLAGQIESGDLWQDLGRPARDDRDRARQRAIAEHVERLLQDARLRDSFARYLRDALGLKSVDEALALLWEPPRSLVFSVWPTLIRRIERQWRRVDGGHDNLARHPLPEFIPRALFEDLNLPEVAIRLCQSEASRRSSDVSEEWMPIRQALSEFAPGRVSRRFGVAHALDAHWVPPPEIIPGSLDIESFCPAPDAQALGEFQYVVEGAIRSVPVIRPYRIHTEQPPRTINDRSNSRPIWHTQIIADASGTMLEMPRGSAWGRVMSVCFHTHMHGNPVELRRFSTATQADRRQRDGTRAKGQIHYLAGETPVGLGYRASVDAIVVDLALPDDIVSIVSRDPALVRSLRVSLFRHRASVDSDLAHLDAFELQVLLELYLACVVVSAEQQESSTREAIDRIAAGRAAHLANRLYPILRAEHDAQNGEDENSLTTPLEDPQVRAGLTRAAEVLVRPLAAEDEPRLREMTKATIGGALVGACSRLCPQVDAGDLFVELSPGPPTATELPPEQLWLTEATVGGAGFVEEVQRRFSKDPRRFVQLLEVELEPSDHEEVDHDLRRVIAALDPDDPAYNSEFASSVADFREASSFADQHRRFENVREQLRARGLATTHASTSALALRVLRAGSSARTDALLASLVCHRDRVEARLEFEVGDASLSALLAEDPEFVRHFADALPEWTRGHEPAVLFNFVVAQCWPHGASVRDRALAFWSPFASTPTCDRLLLHAIVPHAIVTFCITDEHWRSALDDALRQHGRAGLRASMDQLAELRRAVLELSSTPLELDSLLVYARVRACRRTTEGMTLIFDMPEAFQ